MAKHEDIRPSVQEILLRVIEILHKHELVENLVHRQEGPRRELVETLVHRQNLVELQKLLDTLHPADVAYILEALPLGQRLMVWDLVKAERDGEILLEVSDAVRETLIAHMDEKELVAATGQLDTDEIADLAPDLPREVMQDVFRSLPVEEREQLRAAMSYPEDSVGALMDFDVISVRDDVTVEVVLRYLRRLDEMPDHTDQLFVVDREERLQGLLPINRLLVTDPEDGRRSGDEQGIRPVSARLKRRRTRRWRSSATIWCRRRWSTTKDKLVGRVTVNAVVDYIREETDSEMLSAGGLREDEDLFASVWNSVKNRWTWLAINLVTAFIASRVIGVFENSIAKLVALAALMPIIAGIGGNSGNQTITMIVRALALGQITARSARKLFAKEIGVSALNGLIWGGVVGLFAFLIYHSWQLGAGDDRRHGAQSAAGRGDGRDHSAGDAKTRARSGGGLERDDHRDHRQRRIFHFSRAGDDFSGLNQDKQPPMNADERRLDLDRITEKIIGCAQRVSNVLGCGFLEKVYENALSMELRKAGLDALQQQDVVVHYDDQVVGQYTADLLVESSVIVELKAVSVLDDIHRAQCLNYLRATGLSVCLLINFGKPKLEVKRIVLNF